MENLLIEMSKALSRDIRAILSTLHAGRSYHVPLIEKVDSNEAWAAVERANNFTSPCVIMTRDVQIVMLALYDDSYQAMRQGAGRPSTDSTSTTVSIFLGQDSEAR